MSRIVCALCSALTTWIAASGQDVPPCRDPAMPIEKRLDGALSRLSLAEKAAVLNHVGSTVTSLDLRADQWNQCLHGVMWDGPATLFPVCIAMAATWNTERNAFEVRQGQWGVDVGASSSDIRLRTPFNR